jgi:hypothetical protein
MSYRSAIFYGDEQRRCHDWKASRDAPAFVASDGSLRPPVQRSNNARCSIEDAFAPSIPVLCCDFAGGVGTRIAN